MNNQLLGRERDRKRNKELEGELTGYVDTYRRAIHYGDIVNIKFELCDEIFTVTEETVGRLKTAMEIKVVTMNDEPQFKNEFFGEFVSKDEPKPNLDYKIYSPMNYYLLLHHVYPDKSKILTMSQYRAMGGHWLVEYLNHEYNRQWHFDLYEHATYWRKALSDSEGKAEVIFPKYERKIYGNKKTD